MSNRVFVHGVPDTPAMWRALIGMVGGDALAPCLPGFCAPCAEDFDSSKDAYADWLVRVLEARYAERGPIDIFGHDWGALLTLRAVSLRPDLVRTWAISAAAIDPDYRGHTIARIWHTPVLGEVAMAAWPAALMEVMLRRAGLPAALAREEAGAWSPHMRRSILALYRSASGLRFSGDWVDRLAALPKGGLVIWGAKDPYVPVAVAERFVARHGGTLHVERDAGHWVVVERVGEVARLLVAHWGG
jgi:pimeloyl-ACP methyl ester carboxylesterase